MPEGFDHAAWEKWAEDWGKGANLNAYPDFSRWRNGKTPAEQDNALNDVLEQVKAAKDVKTARAVYRHSDEGSTVGRAALNYVLEYSLETKDALLARDVYQHCWHTDDIKAALAAYEEITGSPLTH